MSQCEELVFNNIGRSHFQNIVAKAQSGGIPISGGDAGQAGKNGFTVRWSFSERDATLRLQCVESPMLIPCAVINSRLADLVERSR